MGRLIDADTLNIERKHCNKSQMKAILDFVDAQPTAYDVERVIAELERKKEQCEKDRSYWADRSAVDSCIYNECDLFGSKADLLEETIEIIRKGGAE